MKKQILSLALALTLCLGLSAPAFAAGGGTSGHLDSGSASIPKLSKEEISQLLEDNPLTLPEQVFDETPSCTAPYVAGKVKTEALQAAADRLNALRQIAGLPAVQLDLELSEQVQYGAVIQGALGSLSHYPSQPAGMDDAFYQLARDASSSSNLYAGPSLTQAIDGFMDDSDTSNIDRVGHRRWQLNPTMGKVGFGYAESNTVYRRYVSEYAFDRSGTCRDYDFVAWPASGNFPNNPSGFDQNTAWSVSLNPSEYSTPRQSDLTVTLTRESDGQTWTFQGSNYTAASSGAYFHVDTGGYGIANCIIFRPDGVTSYEGVYTVTIDGLRSASGSPVDFSYQVDFFDPANLDAEPEDPQEPEQPTPSSVALSQTEPSGYEPLYTSWGVEFSSMPRTISGDETEYVFPNGTVMYVPELGNSIIVAASASDYPWIDPTGESTAAFSGPVTLKQFYVQNSVGEWEPLSIPAGGGYITLEPGALYKAEFDYRSVYEQKNYNYQPTFQADFSEEGTVPTGFQAVFTDERFQASAQPLETADYGMRLTFPAGTVFYIPPRGTVYSYDASADEEDVYTQVDYSLYNDQGEYLEDGTVPAVGLYLTLEAGKNYFIARNTANIHYEGINNAQWYISVADNPAQPEVPSFSDVPASFWGYTYIIKASQANLMSGVGSGQFDPNGSLTLAQAAVLAYQIHSQANGGTLPDAAGAWYMPYYQYCLDNGIFTASQFAAADMDRQATRFDMVSILDQAVPASRMTAVKTVADGSIPDLRESDPYGDVVYKWYRAGVVSGDGEGRFNGSTGITRAEVAVILCQLNNLV